MRKSGSSTNITIKDVARKLNLSHTTVSRALNDHPQTSAATKLAVRKAAEELGYVLHSAARSMRAGEGRVIGLVVPVLTTEFYQAVAKVLAEKATAAGYYLVLSLTGDSPEAELGHVRTLVEARAAGVIIAPSPAPLERSIELLRSITCLQLNRYLPEIPCDAVGFDDAEGIRLATEHLRSLGHRRIGFVGSLASVSTGAGRLRGYREALELGGLDPDDALIRLGRPRASFAFEATGELLTAADPPTAVILSGSELTAGGLEAIQLKGIEVPQDLSVVGYTDPIWYRLVRPQLTTIRLPVAALAETTAALLFGRIEHRLESDELSARTPVRVPIVPELVVRASTAAPRLTPKSTIFPRLPRKEVS